MFGLAHSSDGRPAATSPSSAEARLLRDLAGFTGTPSSAAIAQLRSHPALPAAIRASAHFQVELYEGNRLVNLVTSDRGRFVVAALAMYLHHTRRPDDPASGLTAARLRALSAATGLCSAGSASAIIALMRWHGYLTDDETAPRGARLLRPTERLINMHRARWRCQLEAASLVMPEMQPMLARFDEPDFVAHYSVAFAANFLGGLWLYRLTPDVMFFTRMNAGLLVLYEIVLAGAADDAVPPRQAVPVDPAALARQFHVSRAQIMDVLQRAERDGLIALTGQPELRVQIRPRLADDIRTYFPALFLMNAAAALYALAVMRTD